MIEKQKQTGPCHSPELILFSILFQLMRGFAWAIANCLLRTIFSLFDKIDLGRWGIEVLKMRVRSIKCRTPWYKIAPWETDWHCLFSINFCAYYPSQTFKTCLCTSNPSSDLFLNLDLLYKNWVWPVFNHGFLHCLSMYVNDFVLSLI